MLKPIGSFAMSDFQPDDESERGEPAADESEQGEPAVDESEQGEPAEEAEPTEQARRFIQRRRVPGLRPGPAGVSVPGAFSLGWWVIFT